MKQSSDVFQLMDKIVPENPAEGIVRRVMGYDPTLMTVAVTFETGAVGVSHAHPNAQTSYVASGCFDVTIGTQTHTLKAGDGYYVAPNVQHGCVCREAGTLVDNFSPWREDFLER